MTFLYLHHTWTHYILFTYSRLWGTRTYKIRHYNISCCYLQKEYFHCKQLTKLPLVKELLQNVCNHYCQHKKRTYSQPVKNSTNGLKTIKIKWENMEQRNIAKSEVELKTATDIYVYIFHF
jgi:hypothetical protein